MFLVFYLKRLLLILGFFSFKSIFYSPIDDDNIVVWLRAFLDILKKFFYPSIDDDNTIWLRALIVILKKLYKYFWP